MERLSDRITLLKPAPRHVPFPVACSVLTEFHGVFGAFLLSVGMFFFWMFSDGMHPLNAWRLSHSESLTPAEILSVRQTNVSENKVQVYQYRFRYQVGNGLPLEGACYTTGKRWKGGDQLLARYLPDQPAVACLEGARLSNVSTWVILMLCILAAVGLMIVIVTVVSGVRRIQLLRHGEITGSKTISVAPTGATINKVRVMAYSYQFQDRSGILRQGTSKALPTGRVGDEAREPILYLPDRPDRSLLVDSIKLPSPLRVNEQGEWHCQGWIRPVFTFLVMCSLLLLQMVIAVWRIRA